MSNGTLVSSARTGEAESEVLLQGVESALRHIGYNLPTAIGAVNIKAIGFIIALVFLGILLLHWLVYAVGPHIVDATSSYGGGGGGGSYGRTLLTAAADLWRQRNIIGLSPDIKDGRSVESMEPVVTILDLIAAAIRKWDNEGSKEEEKNKREDPQKKKKKKKSRVLF